MFNLIIGFVAGVVVSVLVPKVYAYGVYVVSKSKEFLAQFGSK
jgi:hypothetical protein